MVSVYPVTGQRRPVACERATSSFHLQPYKKSRISVASWWVPHSLKKRNRIIAAVNMRYHKTTHKFGLRVPKNVAECEAIDKENGNTLWMDTVRKEMEAVHIVFKIIGEDEPLPGYQEIPCHLIFTIKMEDFRRKARYVAGGHRTEAPATLTYASVVS